MKYISVVPALRTPFGVDVFDYAIQDDADIRVGDAILVPFRRKSTPALVVSIQPTSDFADKAVVVKEINHVFRFSPTLIPLLDHAANHTFASRPTILHSWLRKMPARRKHGIDHAQRSGIHRADQTIWSANPFEQIITLLSSTPKNHVPETGLPRRGLNLQVHGDVFQQKNGVLGEYVLRKQKVLILTPWQKRADAIARRLGAPCLTAETAAAKAWHTWADFLSNSSQNLLVSTRIGAWLAHGADTVIVDEPENDDHKDDEHEPRIDGRWLARRANLLNPAVTIIQIGTTPPLADKDVLWEHVPTLEPNIFFDHWQRQGGSDFKRLSRHGEHKLMEAREQKRPVVVVDPFRDRDFESLFKKEYPDVPLFNLADLHTQGIPANGLVILTDVSGVGGLIEDIRRTERNLIAFRRLAARAALAHCELHVQGTESQLQEARSWLTSNGVRESWNREISGRTDFCYPPECRRIKIIIRDNQQAAESIAAELKNETGEQWRLEGPTESLRSTQKSPQWILHLVQAAETADISDVRPLLESIAKETIIDLDPIAFFR